MKKEEITETAVVVLPAEVQTLALAVPETKRVEVETTLAQIFQGTADWKAQVEALEIKGISDSMNIALADTYRLNAKKARLAAEKVFDAKREEVQAQMAGFKTEDALWLKSKQVMQILFKEIEDLAEYKSKFAQRYEMEQRELRTQSRKLKVQELNPEVSQAEYENMSEATFDMFLGGLKNDKEVRDQKEREAAAEIVKKQEAEKLHAERKESLMEFWPYVDSAVKQMDLSSVDEKEWARLCATVKDAKASYDKMLKDQAAENLRLQKLADEKEKQLAKEREDAAIAQKAALKKQEEEQKAESERREKMAQAKKEKDDARQKVMFDLGLRWNGQEFYYKDINFHWTDLVCMTDAEFDKAGSGAKNRMAVIRTEEKLEDEKAESDRQAALKKQADLEAELTARNKKEAEAEFALQAEFVAQEKARQAAILAPRKEKLEAWVMGMLIIAPTGLGDDALVNDIIIKFDGFKKWAKIEIEKL